MIGRKTINEFADDAHELAQQRRNRGLHTGKVAAGHDWQRREETDPHEIAALDCLARMRITVDELRDQLAGESLDAIPF